MSHRYGKRVHRIICNNCRVSYFTFDADNKLVEIPGVSERERFIHSLRATEPGWVIFYIFKDQVWAKCDDCILKDRVKHLADGA